MTTTRRIGLSHRMSREHKLYKEDELNSLRMRKVSRPEDDIYCSPTFYQNSQNNEIIRKLSRNENASTTVSQPRRKTPVYSRPELLDKTDFKLERQAETSPLFKWREFLMCYESWIQVTILLLMIFVSVYIIFVEGQSLFSKSQ